MRSRDLPFVKLGQEHDLAAGQFQSVVMAIWNGLIDLPEDSGPMSLGWHIRLDRPLKSELGARDQANRGARVV